MTMTEIEKNPGPDWIVEYQWLGGSGEEIQSVMVFGAADPETALREARYSLDAADEPYAITGVLLLRLPSHSP